MINLMSVIQEIGIKIDLSRGTFNNTVYKDDMLQLKEVGVDVYGNTVYADSGWWESETIIIQDKIRAFKNVVKTAQKIGEAYCKIYTKTSEDGSTWTEYAEINEDNSVNSPVARYAKIKIEIFAEKVNSTLYIDQFDVAGKYDNEYVNGDNGVLELNRDYKYRMEIDDSFSEEGAVLRINIPKSKFKKINNVLME